MYQAVRGAGFYPEGNPYRTGTLQRAFESLRWSLAEGDLILNMNRHGFVLDREVPEGAAPELQLARDCFIRRITSITFIRGPAPWRSRGTTRMPAR